MKILHSMPPYTLFGVEGQEYKDAKIAVLPVPYDSTTSYKAGAREGPHAIIDASRNMEFYSEELDADVTKLGIYTLDELEPEIDSAEGMMERIEREVTNILKDGKRPLLLGGEHSITVGAQMAFAKRAEEFSVLHIDAHSDSREEYMGSRYSHACVAARSRELCGSVFSAGVRSISQEDAGKYSKEILFRKEMHGMSVKEIAGLICKSTRKRIYLTLDVDVLDPGEMPSTGTPEPDGLRFHELTSILKAVLREKEVIGMDFTELMPIAGITAPNYLVAKLIFLTLGYAYL